MKTRDRSLVIALVASFTFALGLRLWNLDAELPYPDAVREAVALDAATEMLDAGRFDPALLHWPGGLVSLTVAPVGLIHVIGGVPLSRPDDASYSPAMRPDEQGTLLFGARWMIALLGALGALLAARAARHLSEGLAVPLLAGAVVAVLPAHLDLSQRLWPEVPASFGAVLACWAALAIVRNGTSARRLLGAGAALGLATAFKFAGGMVGLAVLAAIAFDTDRSRTRRLASALFALGVAVVVFALLSPWTLLSPGETWAAVTASAPSAGGPIEALARLAAPTVVGPAVLALAGLSAGLLLVKGRPDQRRLVVVLLLPLLGWLLLLVLRGPAASVQLAAIMAPTLALAAALTVGYALRAVPGRTLSLVLAAAVGLALVPTALAGGTVAWVKGLANTRTQAGAWFAANVPEGAGVVRDWAGPELDPQRFRVVAVPTVLARSWQSTPDSDFDFLVLTTASFALAEGDGARSREVTQRLQAVFTRRPAVAFCPVDDRVRGQEIWVFPRSDRARRQFPEFRAHGHCRYDRPWIR